MVEQARRSLPRWLVVWAPSLVPALAMLAVGWFRIGNPSLGWDENATYAVSQRSIPQILDLARHTDGVIAPYYLFMHLWTAAFGVSEFALRAPSLIFVAVGVGLAGELGRRLFGARVGLIGGLLLVTIPQLSRYAQDARAYGLAFMAAVLATLLLYRALQLDPGDLPRERRRTTVAWLLYGAAVLLLGLSHIIGLLVLVGHAFTIGLRRRSLRDRTTLTWAAVTALAVLAVTPLILRGLTQRGGQLAWIDPVSPTTVISAPQDVFLSAGVAWLLIGVALVVRWPDPRPVAEFAVTAVVPPVALLAASKVAAPIWVPRYVLFVLAPIALLAAASVRFSWIRTVLVLAAAATVGLPAQLTARGPATHHGPDFRAASRIIEARLLPGDGIVYAQAGNWSLRAGMDYNLRGRPAPADLLITRPAAAIGKLRAAECADPAPCVGSTQRVWLFRQWRTDRPLAGTDVGPAVGHLLGTAYRLVGLWQVSKGTVVLYQRLITRSK